VAGLDRGAILKVSRLEVITMTVTTSVWKGSRGTASMVAGQIKVRFGAEVASKYDPRKNCFTFLGWKQRGYTVKRGEKAIKSVTFIKDVSEDELTVRSYPKNVYLFCEAQVEKV